MNSLYYSIAIHHLKLNNVFKSQKAQKGFKINMIKTVKNQIKHQQRSLQNYFNAEQEF